jgi:hypothetical protein
MNESSRSPAHFFSEPMYRETSRRASTRRCLRRRSA